MLVKQLSYVPILLALSLVECSGGGRGIGNTGGSAGGGKGGSGAKPGTAGHSAGGVVGTDGGADLGGNGGPTTGIGGAAGKGAGGGMGGVIGAGGAGTGGTQASCANCYDQGLKCSPTGRCVSCLTDADCPRANGSNAACLNGRCGCNDDSQCTGEQAGTRCVQSSQKCGCETDADCSTSGALKCAPNHQCGCGSNADCVGKTAVGGGSTPVPVCDPSSGFCVQCLTDGDCTDPNARACYGDRCYACHASADCAQNADGSLCQEIGGKAPGIGQCGCTVDTDCAGHSGGPHCVSNISTFKKCGCATAADCVGDAQGHACVNPGNDGWLQCGCSTAADCPSGKACLSYVCGG